MDVNQYMGMFLEESKEHLQVLNSCLLEIENNPNDLSVLDEIFRSAHTIKGMSATMGFTTIAELTHVMENVLDMLRKSVLAANREIIDMLFQCVDTLEQLVESIASESNREIDIKPLLTKLNNIAQGNGGNHSENGIRDGGKEKKADKSSVEETRMTKEQDNDVSEITIPLDETDEYVIKLANTQGLLAYEVSVSLDPGCMLKAARAYMIMSALEEFGDVVKSIPPVDDLERGNFEDHFQTILLASAETEKIENSLFSISEVSTATVLPINIESKAEEKGRINKADEIPQVIKGGEVSKTEISEKTKLSDESRDKANKTPAHPSEHKVVKGAQSVRVDIDKLDTLLNLVGELVINKTRLEQIGITHRLTELVETIEQMDRITTDLQTVVMKVRMVPVGQVFNRFPRMVRDLSRELKKEINLIIRGEETELDRTVIDEIGDPLVHLLRNSIDHGIELPEEREANGKKPVGEVRLTASHEGNNVIIMVEDDGHGINPDRVKKKALEKGLITSVEAEKMDASEAVKLVFLPGFSTVDVVTDVSGRGVGMDAVKTKIESLGGMVDVETKINEGSKFKIRLPLTLAIIQALLVKVSEEIYAIPLGSIDSTINITPDDIKTVQNEEVILLRGQIIPIIRLANSLNVPCDDEKVPEELFIVVVHAGDYRAGIIVDSLIGQQDIVIKSMGKLLAGIKVIAGATILGNGQVALILDVGTLKK